MSATNVVKDLIKAIEAGSYDAAPGTLTQGSALQVEDLSPVMNNVTFGSKHLKLQKTLGVKSCKSTTYQFNRQLSYGQFGGSAQLEGVLGLDETSTVVRVAVPMSYYSEVRRVTFASTMVATVDGKESSDRAAEDAAMRLGGDIEFDCFRGGADFSNAGVFDGNPLALPGKIANMQGFDVQVRMSDVLATAKDMMFAEYGSNESVVISAGGVAITQDKVEDVALRNNLNMGSGGTLMVDPVALAGYNRISFGKDRIVLAGAPQEATGANLNKQWVANGGTVPLESSIFLRGKFQPAAARANSPGAPSISLAVAAVSAAIPAGTYIYYATGSNEVGESLPSTTASQAVASGEKVTVTCTLGSGSTRWFNLYRSTAGGTTATAKFIGRVKANASGTTDFTDLGNRIPASTTGYLVDSESGAEIRELAPFSKKDMALNDLSSPAAFYRFCCLALPQPRKSVLLDNVKGTL